MMVSKRWQGLLMMALVVTLTSAFASPAFAQRDTGIMSVRAIDPDGVALPGVMVVAAGPVGTQTQYTGVDGTARFPGLYPGDGYTATFTLNGFKTVIREGLRIQAQRTTAFDLVMELATVEETITVTGESPIVDVKSTNLAGLYSDDMLDKSPSASGLWAGILDHVPGVMASTDVGGGDAGQQTSPRAWGSETRNNTYNVNGGDVTDQQATGASSAYLSTGAFEEVSVSLAAQDIEIKTPGVNMNMVVKSGSNDWHGGVKYFYEGEGLVSNNVDQELMDQGVTEGTPNELLSDLDIQGGGPIVNDRAWFFLDYWNFEIKKVVLGLEERDQTKLRDWTLNVNAQINDNNKVSGRYLNTLKFRNNRSASQARPYLGRVQDMPTQIPQLQWQSVISQNIFTDIRYSAVRNDFPLIRRWEPGVPQDGAVPSDVSATWNFSIGNYVPRPSTPTFEFLDERDTTALNGTASWYVTGENTSHDIKFGGSYQWLDYSAPGNYPLGYRRYVRSNRDPMGNPNWVAPDGSVIVPVEIRLYNAPIAAIDGGAEDCFVLNSDCWSGNNAFTQKGRALGLFLQDTMTIANRVTIIAGLRFDRAYNWNPAQNRLDSPWCGFQADNPLNNPDFFCGGTFAAQDVPFHWNNITPRVGVVYDIMGDGRWALKGNYSQYAEQLGTTYSSATNVNDIASEDWNWTDANGDGLFQYGEQTTFRSQNIPGVGTAIDPNLHSPLTHEVTFGLDHELFDNILVSVTGIYRTRIDDVGTVNQGRPFGQMFTNERCIQECTPVLPFGVDPYAPVQTVDPGNDGIIGTADDGRPITVYALNPATFGTGVNLTTNPNTWGFDDNNDYRGVSFVMSKRWSNNWQLLASYDYGKGFNQEEGVSPNALFNGRRAELFGSRPHIFKVTANYLFAEPIGVNLGVFVRAQSGEPLFFNYTYDDSVLEPPNGPFPNQGNTRITVDARGQADTSLGRPTREGFMTIVDIRAEKQVTIGRYGVMHFYFDVFNLFNNNVITELNEVLGTQYLRVDDVLSPRVIRIGGAWDF